MIVTEEALRVLEALSYLATIFGIPTALLLFLADKRRERREQEFAAHQVSNDRYLAYLGMCLDRPELETFEFRSTDRAVLESKLSVQQLIMFTFLASTIETAFLRYRGFHSGIQERHWSGWQAYAREWSERGDFRAAWKLVGSQFDSEFVREIQDLIDNSSIRTPDQTLT